MEPLRVTFHLVTPMRAPEQPIHLDALLAWAAVDRAEGDLAAQEELPLERHVARDGRWVWKASQVIARVEQRSQQAMIRSFEPWRWGEDRGRSYTKGPNILKAGTGPNKGYQFTVPMLQVATAHAWCIGDPEAIRGLMERVTHLGKLRRLDCGRIAKIAVTQDLEAVERWMLRAMPEPWPGYRQCQQTLRPPYFQRALREHGWEPPASAVAAAMPALPCGGETSCAAPDTGSARTK